MHEQFQPGNLVRVRGREWVVLPSDDSDILRLHPLNGSERESLALYRPLLAEEVDLAPARFPLPTVEDLGNWDSALLLWDAARLLLRSGAGPFRSLGRISVRPRPYQLVPLLMALRLHPVRMLIADDVGVGKTIEAGLIARELLDRGEIRRLAVLAPPYLCDQWEQELRDKFHLNPVVVRSGTVARLERGLPHQGVSIYEHYPVLVISIDFVKSARHKHAFLQHCPELVIVDEAHGATRPGGQGGRQQQQRYELVRAVAQNPQRHLLLLTATPHSGVEASFKSLLGLLNPRFEDWDMQHLSPAQRRELARHFVQRRRADVEAWLGEETRFPQRDSSEAPYDLSSEYKHLFREVYRFARELVRAGAHDPAPRRRMRYWAALALLRSVMSSPAAAEAALRARMERLTSAMAGELAGESTQEMDATFGPLVYDRPEADTVADVAPRLPIEEAERTVLAGDEQRRLRRFAVLARRIRSAADTKLQVTESQIRSLLREGYHPIVWCRFIATAKYVAEALQQRLRDEWPEVRVIAVTGELADEERRLRVEELSAYPQRVLVATDCLSEGINLQEGFDAVVHYDLPWNPNRLEQREGRVDRFGQRRERVKAIMIYGRDNPVDGAVLDVLLRKARDIRRTLGVAVPVPINSESVMEALLNALLLRGEQVGDGRQLSLFGEEEYLLQKRRVFQAWDKAVERERRSRTIFAQHALRPEEVQRELEEVDAVLGDPAAVERFVRTVTQRLEVRLIPGPQGIWRLDVAKLPATIRERLPGAMRSGRGTVRVSFHSPTPLGVHYIGRNHPLTEALAEEVLGAALTRSHTDKAAYGRVAVIRSSLVQRQTTLFLLRLRYLLHRRTQKVPLLAEEVAVAGLEGRPGKGRRLSPNEALHLLQEVRPEVPLPTSAQQEALQRVLSWWERGVLEPEFRHVVTSRQEALEKAYRRVHRAARMSEEVRVEPKWPPDWLGVYMLLPGGRG